MSTKIGRFEILSELAKSDSGCVYKANDPESGQTLALKTIRLEPFGEHAEEVVNRVLHEAETTKDLSSPNITVVYGAGEIDGQFCAAMEYVQGNSVATMVARKEGFSIWDLLDISRQVCQGLDHAHTHNVFHCSLEPAKVMVTWDGTVKILSFGVTSTGHVAATAVGAPPPVLYYMSPEQVRGEPLDARSNLFSWGAMLYEMVTDQKPFDGADADAVRGKILHEMPAPPTQFHPKINRVASEVIMKALAKDPAERYQSGHDMVNDLERCREAVSKTAKKAEPAKPSAVSDAAKAAAATRFAARPAERDAAPKFEVKPAPTRFEPPPTVSSDLETAWTVPTASPKPVGPMSVEPPRKVAAAAAGWGSGATSTRKPSMDPSAQDVCAVVNASGDAIDHSDARMSSAVLDEPAVEQPRIAVDPLMAEDGGAGKKGFSFSDLDELPPLKEVYVPPSAPKSEESMEEEEQHPSIVLRRAQPEKPKVQPREVAEKAIKEIKSVPPQLLMYSLAGALVLILVIGIAVIWHSLSQSTDEEGAVVPAPAASTAQTEPAQAQPSEPAQPAVEAEAPAEPAVVEEPEVTNSTPALSAKDRGKRNKKNTKASASAVIPGQLVVDSTPPGAQVQIDGRGEASWVTPYTVTALAPGAHTVVISKSGYVQEIRTAEVTAANRSALTVHLTPLIATLAVGSTPAGAAIYVDGRDTSRVTPSQITLEKGTHTILVRKAGYLDETVAETAQPGQTLHFAPTLRPLGNADEIKTVGKFKKLFGGGAQAGMGKVSIKTMPKGAQIAINRRILEKVSPTEFLLNPGNYILDITSTGYKPVQKVIVVDQGGTVAIDEVLEPQ